MQGAFKQAEVGILWILFDKTCSRHLRRSEQSSENTISHLRLWGYAIQKPRRQLNRCEWQLPEAGEGAWGEKEEERREVQEEGSKKPGGKELRIQVRTRKAES